MTLLDFPSNYQLFFKKCPVCHKSFLVEVVELGTTHLAGINVLCAKCTLKSPYFKDFVKERPDEAKKIIEWVKTVYEEEFPIV